MSERDEWDDDYQDHYYDELDDDEPEVMICGLPGCILSGWQYHTSEECYTAAHVEAYERYHNPRWWQAAWDWLLAIPHRLRMLHARWTLRGRCPHCGEKIDPSGCAHCVDIELPF